MVRDNCIETIDRFDGYQTVRWGDWARLLVVGGVRLVARDAKALMAALAVWAERARARRSLATLDDRMLADIGATREQAAREAAKPFWRA